MRFRLIEAETTQHPVSLLCSVLGVTRAGYYQWKRRGLSRRALADDRLAGLIARIFKGSHDTYGGGGSRPRKGGREKRRLNRL